MPKRYEVRLSDAALQEMMELHEFIADRTSERVASGYLARIQAAIDGLETFPERGTLRDDLMQGLRVLGFERRAAILFVVNDRAVVVHGVRYGGRDFEAEFGADDR